MRAPPAGLALLLALAGCSRAAAPAPAPAPSPVYAPKPVATYWIHALDSDRFEPSELHGQAGQLVKLVIVGASKEHDFSSPDLNVVVNLPPREVQIVTVALPTTPGSYAFWSAHPGDRDAGMSGHFVVEPAAH